MAQLLPLVIAVGGLVLVLYVLRKLLLIKDRTILGIILGIATLALWFAPFVSYGAMYQAGHHIGGLAYLLPLASVAFGILSFLGQFKVRFIVALAHSALCLLYVSQAWASIGWGLIVLTAVSLQASHTSFADFRNLGDRELARGNGELDVVSKIERLQELRKQGALTDEEFENQKAKVMSSARA